MKRILALLACAASLLVSPARGADYLPPLLLRTNAAIANYTNFFDVNIGYLTGALTAAGYGGGGGGSGTVTSVSLSAPSIFSVSGSPITGAGTIGMTLAAQSPNVIFAGPGSGGSATPTFRALVDADIPEAIARDAEVTAAVGALSSVYQPLDSDLSALANGTAMPTPLTNAVSLGAPIIWQGNTNLLAYIIAQIAGLSATYQPLDADLTDLADGSLTGSKVGTGISAANVTTGLLPTNVLPASITGKLDPTGAGTGLSGIVLKAGDTMTGALTLSATAAPGASNLVAATTEYVDKAVALGGGGGGGSGTNNALLTASQTFTGTNNFTGKLIASNAAFGDITASNVVPANAMAVTVGGTGGRSPAEAQTNLLVVPGTHVQTQNATLQGIADLALTNTVILVYSNGIAQQPISAASLALLRALDAAAQRTLLDVPQTDNSSYGPGWSGVTTKSPSSDKVYAAILGLSGSSNLIKSVDATYFLVDTNGQLKWIAGSGGSGFTNFSQFVVNTPAAGNHWKFDGNGWTNAPPDGFEESDTWEFKDWDFTGANTTAILEPGLIAMGILSGSYYVTNYSFSGSQAVGIKTAANDTVTTGNGFFWGATGGSFSLGTNIHKARFRFFFPNTNAASTGFAGWGTTFSAEHTHALGFSWTNMLLCVQAVTNSTKAVGTTLQLYPLVDYELVIRHTNTYARLQAKSNGVPCYDYTFSTGIPIGFANLMWGGLFVKNQSALATNAGTLLVIDRIQTATRPK